MQAACAVSRLSEPMLLDAARIVEDNDGPMLEALKRLNGESIHLPTRPKDRPDRDRLALRSKHFNAVHRG
jgi:hypothetical protein